MSHFVLEFKNLFLNKEETTHLTLTSNYGIHTVTYTSN